jgi:hypothetical protein
MTIAWSVQASRSHPLWRALASASTNAQQSHRRQGACSTLLLFIASGGLDGSRQLNRTPRWLCPSAVIESRYGCIT